MKKTFTLYLFIVLITGLQAQSEYAVEIFTENYQDLVGATELSDPNDQWDDPSYSIPLGFTANLLGIDADSLFTAEAVGGSLYTTSDYYYNSEDALAFFFYLVDLEDRGAGDQEYSPISFQTTGNAGDQIFKFEYKNAGFFNEIGTVIGAPSFVNVQFWLYESDNSWESRIGPSNIPDSTLVFEEFGGPIVGYGTLVDSDFTSVSVVDDSTNPATIDTINIDDYYTFSGLTSPEENTVIRFFEVAVGSKSPNVVTGVKLFPTLANNQIFLEVDNQELIKTGADVKIYNISGHQFYDVSIQSNGTLKIPTVGCHYRILLVYRITQFYYFIR